ncbi:hypothetical protein V1599_14875 [Enterobacter sp. ECC-175]|uniref:hypothetical protein n=1 Tax=unclassified Enterobacter TaxID=2608935 RepID=UPI000D3F9FA0|nr:hypothetical protein [Enterobacter sp. RIT 418]RAU35204.1 hypothetical protein DBY73_013515 [Enterobacter sp. RIT 418]
MKWANYYLLILENDKQCFENAIYLIERYNIPVENINTTQPINGFPHLNYDFLKGIGLSDKLMIIGHGRQSPPAIGGVKMQYSPSQLALFLKDQYKVNEVGLISFKACDLGNGSFLYDFFEAFTSGGGKIGGCIGYKGEVMNTTRGEAVGLWDYVKRELFLGKNPDQQRVTIVQGNAEVPSEYGNKRRFKRTQTV